MPRATPSLVRWASCVVSPKIADVRMAAFAPFSFQQELSKAEIQQLHLAALGNENVSGLDVPVDNRFRMSSFKGVGNLKPEIGEVLEVYALIENSMFKCLSLQIFHDDEVLAFISSISWMVQICGWFRDEAARASR